MSAGFPFFPWMRSSQNPLLNCITRLNYSGGHATGFYYNHKSNTFLITNRHVLLDEEDNHELDELTYYIRDFGDVQNFNPVTVDISGGEGEDWFTHPLSGHYGNADYFDIAVLPINQKLDNIDEESGSAQTASRGITQEMLIPNHPNLEIEDIGIGSTVSVVGYPGLYTDSFGDFPVLRSAVIASRYGLPYNGDPVFLIDARMHKGTSGSPVVVTPGSSLNRGGISVGGNYALLGVHSMSYQNPGAEHPDEKWLDLNGVWYAQLVDTIIDSIDY